jgi:hypothetical protein
MPAEVVEAVFKRDRERLAAEIKTRGGATEWLGDRMRILAPYNFSICPAILIDPDEFGKCWGRWTMDHVNKQATRGKRAPHSLATVISLCEGHTEPGMKAGHVWNTANRPLIRTYLLEANA